MNEDVTLSKDYLAAVKHARKIGNIDTMYDLSISLLSELGITDEQAATASSELGKRAAESRNSHNSGQGGSVPAKKL